MRNGFQQLVQGCTFTESLRSADSTELLRSVGGDAIQLQASDDNSSTAAPRRFTCVVYTGGVMTPELNLKNKYQGPVVVDLKGLVFSQVVPLHRDHDTTKPVAHTETVSEDGTSLHAAGVFSIANDDSTEVVSGLEGGFPWKPSIGLKVHDYELIPEGRSIAVNNQTFEGPILLISSATLKEVGVVTVPGDPEVDAIQLAAKLAQGSETMSFEDWIKSLGLDLATLSDEAKAALQMQYDAQQSDSVGDADEVDAEDNKEDKADAADGEDDATDKTDDKTDATASAKAKGAKGSIDLRANYRKQMAAEETRAHKVRSICAKFGNPEISIGGSRVQLAAHAIAEGWSSDKTELQARRYQDLETKRSGRPSGPAIHSTSRRERGDLAAMQGGIMLRAGIALDNPRFNAPLIRSQLPEWMRHDINHATRQRAMDNAQEFRHMSTFEVCQAACDLSGVTYSRGDKMGTLKAALSTGNVSVLFGATIGAKVLESYAEIKDFSEGWVETAENPDLEQHIRIRLEGAQDLEHNPVGQPAAHATRATKNEYAAVGRFAKQMNFDEADLLGDNFGKLKDTPRDFGLAAGRVIPNLVASVLLSNPTLLQTTRALFNTTDGTSATGVALARATLSAAIALLAKRKDGDASLNLSPTHLIVPPDLVDLANQLINSAVISNDSGSGNTNVLNAYGIQVVGEARLANGVKHPVTGVDLAGSATQWYLLSAEAHTIEVTFLEGAGRVPMVRTTELTNGMFGLNVDVRHYAGATPLDFRGFYRGNS